MLPKDSNPRWKLEQTETIRPNENVLIEMFVSGGRRVKVSTLENKSEAEAMEVMKLAGRWIACSNRECASNKRLKRTRHEPASLLSCVGEPLKRSVGLLLWLNDEAFAKLKGERT